MKKKTDTRTYHSNKTTKKKINIDKINKKKQLGNFDCVKIIL